MREKLIDGIWYLGVRAFRLTRKMHLSTRLEPLFIKASGLIPATRGELSASMPNGKRLLMPADYRDLRTVRNGLFQSDETKLFEELCRSGMTVIDVGAYVGYFTILASSLVGPRGRVYALEPETTAFEYLKRNIHLNECTNVVAINKAASDKATTVLLRRDPKGPESFVTDSLRAFDGETVEALSLDSLLGADDWPRVDVVKMNIEGSELKALKGMRELSSRNPALQLVMEFNPTAMLRAGVSREDLTVTLSELGFRRGQIVERNLKEVPQPDLLPRVNTVYNIHLTK